MKNKARIVVGIALITFASAALAEGGCRSRIDALRQMQANTAYLDAQRADLVQLRNVAARMAGQGREELCMQLVDELEALVTDHRRHAEKVNDLANYASAVPVKAYQGDLNSANLVDMAVRNRVGEELGEVYGLKISANTGSVESLQVTTGGFMGIGERTVRVPWNRVHLAVDGSAVVLDLTQEALKDLPQVE